MAFMQQQYARLSEQVARSTLELSSQQKNEKVILQNQNQVIEKLYQKIEELEGRVKSQEISFRIFDEVHLLKKNENSS